LWQRSLLEKLPLAAHVGVRVDILWPDGETEAIKGFITEFDAVQWIAEHSRAEQGNTNNTSAQPP
jgi:hypothetical protein